MEDSDRLDAPRLLAALRELPTEELAQIFCELDTLHHSTAAHRLLVLAVLDERGIGRDDGMLDTVGWVTWTARLTQQRARALVEAARALPDRPEIATIALEGRLSDEQLEAVVQVATPERDAEWADAAPGWTATSLRAAARNRKAVTRDDAVERDRRRELTYRWDTKRGELRLRGRIPDADDGGIAITNDTARKLACDSKVQALLVDGKCVPINFGRRTRTVPDRLFRLLKERDLHCRAPGCTRTRGLHAHHVVHWIDGGPTDLDNLVLLCNRHHTMLHEHGWTIRGKPRALEFVHHDGRPVTPCRPPPLDPAVRDRLLVTTT